MGEVKSKHHSGILPYINASFFFPLLPEVSLRNFLLSELPVRIVKPLRVKIALEKHRGYLECQVSRPNAVVKWYKDSQEIQPSQKYEIVSDGVYRKLLINDAEFGDEGLYTCDATDDKSSAQFYVEGIALALLSSPFLG